MKKLKSIYSFLIILLITLPSVMAQDMEERELDAFRKIRVSQAIDVYLIAGNDEHVSIETKGISPEHVLTEVSGDFLKIHLEHGRYGDHQVKAYVIYVAIDDISASSASGVFTEGTIKGNRLNISVSSAADVELKVDINELYASASSSGDLELTGRAENLHIEVSSAGGVDAFDLEADNATVRASSAGGAKVAVNRKIDARASSGGSIRYRGNPEESQTDSSSGGSVRKSE